MFLLTHGACAAEVVDNGETRGSITTGLGLTVVYDGLTEGAGVPGETGTYKVPARRHTRRTVLTGGGVTPVFVCNDKWNIICFATPEGGGGTQSRKRYCGLTAVELCGCREPTLLKRRGCPDVLNVHRGAVKFVYLRILH